jgi:hypothetical protein
METIETNLTCPGSNRPPRTINTNKHTGWCTRCRDQHILRYGLIPHHNTELGHAQP